MTPTEEKIRDRHLAFRAEIARRAALVPQKEERTYCIPNTPFGVRKINPMPPLKAIKAIPNPEPDWWHCMWFYDLVACCNRKPNPPSMGEIMRTVSLHFGVTKDDIILQGRPVHIVRPRQVVYYLSKKLTDRSLPEIGRRLGGRDHTSILAGIRRIEKLRKTDHKLDADIRAIVSALGAT